MSETLVKVDNVSKRFCRDLKRSLWYGLKDIGSELLGGNGSHDSLRRDEFWAVKDVSFELKRGECMGLIGHNGAGKSTLLKMLNGLIKPDKGTIRMKGRVGALIELGAGFNPVLTGRENIYVNGQVLGFAKKEIDRKFNAIVDFAEISDFIDTPVQNYSSGMKVKLGFAVAAQMEPDILIIDEVLAVGDIGFQLKCYNAINELIKTAAVIFVSHNVQQVARLCDSILQLQKGAVDCFTKDVYKGIQNYLATFDMSERSAVTILNRVIDIDSLTVNGGSEGLMHIKYGDQISLCIVMRTSKTLSNIVFGVAISDQTSKPVAFFVSESQDIEEGVLSVTFESHPVHLNRGYYYMTLIISRFENPDASDRREILGRFDNFSRIHVEHDCKILLPAAYLIDGSWKIAK